MLSGDNGILQRATDAKNNNDNSQIQERINLVYHSALTSGLGKVEESTLKDEIKKEFNKTDSELEEENWLDKTSVTGKWRITIAGVSLDVPAGIEATKTVIDYGSKTSETVSKGDDITIGTEKFMVLKNDGTTIQAIPYYNITLTAEPIQSPDAGTIAFSGYISSWESGTNDIDMMNTQNNIQQYITSYQNTLQKLGATGVRTRILKENTDSSIIYSENINLNPSNTGKYWLGSYFGTSNWAVMYYVDENGYDVEEDIVNGFSTNADTIGVRPLIEINL